MGEQSIIQWVHPVQVQLGGSVILLRIPEVRLSSAEVTALIASSIPAASPELNGPEPRTHICHAADSPETYVYLAAHMAELRIIVDALKRAVQGSYPEADVIQLSVTQVVDGASVSQSASWHYVVETDVRAAAEDDFNAWYSEEHLPGLAAVPGTVRAIRLQQSTGSPRYHALYLLATRETFGSEPWLQVRATEWSSRVRPNFINTKRTMFEIESD